MRYILLSAIAISVAGCAIGAGPIGYAFGDSWYCRGKTSMTYSEDGGNLLTVSCEDGTFVQGGHLSKTSAGLLEGTAGTMVDIGLRAIGGLSRGGGNNQPTVVVVGEGNADGD